MTLVFNLGFLEQLTEPHQRLSFTRYSGVFDKVSRPLYKCTYQDVTYRIAACTFSGGNYFKLVYVFYRAYQYQYYTSMTPYLMKIVKIEGGHGGALSNRLALQQSVSLTKLVVTEELARDTGCAGCRRLYTSPVYTRYLVQERVIGDVNNTCTSSHRVS